MAERSGTEEAVKGAVEGAKGKAKEVVGKVTDRDDLRREGQAQQDKADAQRDAGKQEGSRGRKCPGRRKGQRGARGCRTIRARGRARLENEPGPSR